MRNYIRYIVLLVLIIAGGLLIISVVNKFSEPDVSKVDNSNQAEETTTDEKPSLDVDTTTDDTQTEDDASTGADSTDSSGSSIVTDSVVVPNTAADSSIVFTVLGFSMIIGGVGLVKRRAKKVNN